jgi:hypothetical protein
VTRARRRQILRYRVHDVGAVELRHRLLAGSAPATCARCGRPGAAQTMIWSQWTRRHYCLDVAGCTRRAAARRRAAVTALSSLHRRGEPAR